MKILNKNGGIVSDLVQQMTGTGTVTQWNSLVEITLTADATITLPVITDADVNILGQKITFRRLDATAFKVTLVAAAGETLVLQSLGTELNAQYGSLTVQVNSLTSSVQVSNIGTAPVLSEYGQNTGIVATTVTGTLADVTGSAFTLPSAGVWKVDYTISGEANAGNLMCNLYTSANVLVPNTQTVIGTTGLVRTSPSMTAYITTTGSEAYKLRALINAGTGSIQNSNVAAAGNSKITWEKVGGFLPVIGTTTDLAYTEGLRTSNPTITFQGINIRYNNATTNIELSMVTGTESFDFFNEVNWTGGVANVGGTRLAATTAYATLGEPGTVDAGGGYRTIILRALSTGKVYRIEYTWLSQPTWIILKANNYTSGIQSNLSVGSGLVVNNSVLSAETNRTTTALAAYTIEPNELVVNLSLAGAQTLTLPLAAIFPKRVLKVVNPTPTVKTLGTAYNTIFGFTNTSIQANSWIEIQSDGTSWNEISASDNSYTIVRTGAGSGVLGGVTFTTTNADPLTLTTSIAATGYIMSEITPTATGITSDSWTTTATSGGGASILRGRSWNGVTTGSIGLVSAAYCHKSHGVLVSNGRTFEISSYSYNGTHQTIIKIIR